MDKSLSLFRHLRNYATGGLFSAIIGVASFPILTRTLSVEDYGVLGLILSSLTLFLALGKFGVQHSILRFYAEIKNRSSSYSDAEFFSTTLSLAIVLGFSTMLIWLISGFYLVPLVTSSEKMTTYFLVGTLYILFRMLSSNICNVLAAQLQSNVVMVSVIVRRAVYIGLILLYAVTSMVSIELVVAAFVVAEFVCLLYVLKHYLPEKIHSRKFFRGKLANALLWFGVPLMILESLGLILRLSDRYIIQYLLDDNALGQYAASHNFSSYIEIIITSAMITAIKPLYTEIWESQGEKPTQDFLSRGLHIYLIIGIPFVALFSLTAPHVINILASTKYEAGTVIVPWVASAILVEGAVLFVAAGIYLKKETSKLVFWGFIAVIANIALNFLLVPLFGIVGAAVVTLFTFTLYCLGIMHSAFKLLEFQVDVRKPLMMAVASIIVWAVLSRVTIQADFLALLFKGTAGLVTLLVFGLWLDQELRKLLAEQVGNVAPRLGNTLGPRLLQLLGRTSI